MSCPCSAPPSSAACCRAEVVTRAAAVLTGAGNLPPGLVVVLADDDGVLLATRPADRGVGPSDVQAVCSRLLELSPPRGPAAAVVVSLDPGFDTGGPAVSRAWRDMRRCFERSHTRLVDWLLVTGTTTTSVAAARGEPVSS